MRTPLLESLAALSPKVARVLSEVVQGDKESLETQLQETLNSEFGDTVSTLEALESINQALGDVLETLED